jgi:hypothetical protein
MEGSDTAGPRGRRNAPGQRCASPVLAGGLLCRQALAGGTARGRVRWPMASAATGLALALAAPGLAQPEERVGVTLTQGADIVVLRDVGLLFDRAPNTFGLAPEIVALGVSALGGNDDVTLTGAASIRGKVEQFRVYTGFPADPGTIADILASPRIVSTTIGADGGAGLDRLDLEGTMHVHGESVFTQTDLDVAANPLPVGFVLTVSSSQEARATGLTGGSGADQLGNGGALTVRAETLLTRADLGLSMLNFGDVPQNGTGMAHAIGLDGGTDGDTLVNREDASLAASARSRAFNTRLAVSGVTIASPQNAAVAIAEAEGMAGGDGVDTLVNLGTVDSRAEALMVDAGAVVTATGFSLPEVALPPNPVSNKAEARATGLAGGAGADLIENAGIVSADARAVQGTGSLTVRDSGIDTAAIEVLISRPGFPTEPPGGAIARATGIAGDPSVLTFGFDQIVNSGSASANAFAEAYTLDIFITAPINSFTGVGDTAVGKILSFFGLGLANISADAAAYAAGIAGSAGRDTIVHSGQLSSSSTANANTAQVSLNVLSFIAPPSDEPTTAFNLSLDVFSIGANSLARSTGIASHGGQDSIETLAGSSLSSSASSRSRTGGANIAVTKDDKAFKASGSVAFVRSWTDSEATGIDAGANGAVDARGSVVAISNALAQSLDASVGVRIVDSGLTLNVAVVDTDILARSAATGIRATQPLDFLNTGLGVKVGNVLRATSSASVESLAVAFALDVVTGKGLAGNGSFISADHLASAIATGINRSGPLPEQPWLQEVAGGITTLLPGAIMQVQSTASASRIGIGVNAAGTNKGAALAVQLMDLRLRPEAEAIGFLGGDGLDLLSAAAPMTVRATANGFSTSTSVQVGIANNGVAAGVAGVLADSSVRATARGVDLGTGANEADIQGNLSAVATATNVANGNAIAVNGANNGVGIGASFVSMETGGRAEARGIIGGSDRDAVALGGILNSNATVETTSVAISLGMSGAVNGVGVGGGLAKTAARSEALGTGFALGAGNDILVGSGAMNVRANANTVLGVGSLGLGAAVNGVGVGASLVDAGSTALAEAIGGDGEAGDDAIVIARRLDTRSVANAENIGVSIGLGLSQYGVGAGGSAVLSDVRANARAVGLSGGLGSDSLLTSDIVFTSAIATARRIGVSIGAAGSIGATFAATFLKAGTSSLAEAVGLAGDRFELAGGNDTIESRGRVDTRASATATGTEVNLSFSIGVGLAANIVDSDVRARAHAVGIDAGRGNDMVVSAGGLESRATSQATSASVSLAVGLVGLNFGDLSTSSDAVATGIIAGPGDDRISTMGTLLADANATARAASVGVAFTGASLLDAGIRSNARAVGLEGVGGSNDIRTGGPVSAVAQSTTELGSAQIALTGAAGARLDSRALATATAILGGGGDDVFESFGPLSSQSIATLRSVSLSFNLQGAAGNDISNTAQAGTVVVALLNGNNRAVLNGGLSGSSVAQVISGALQANVLGVGAGSVGGRAFAGTTGYSGGAGTDTLILLGPVNLSANATLTTGSGGLTLGGLSLARTSAESRATATLTTLGGGNGLVLNFGSGSVVADAAVTAANITASLAGAGLQQLGAEAIGNATGVRGGLGRDEIRHAGNLTVRATARSTTGSLNGAVAGGGVGTVKSEAVAQAVAIDGWNDDDLVDVEGPLSAIAVATASLTGIQANAVGGSSLQARLQQTARATGIDAGAGNDRVRNFSRLEASSTANSTAQTFDVRLAGAGLLGGTSAMLAVANGMLGLTGNDFLGNYGQILVQAASSGQAGAMQLTLAGAANGDNRMIQEAVVVGMDGGSGNDLIANDGTIGGTATAVGRTGSVQASVAGSLRSSADNLAIARGTGIAGGSGDDIVESRGRIGLVANATGGSGSVNVVLAGATSASVRQVSEAALTGIDAGNGNDQVSNAGVIDLASTATLRAINRSLSVIGSGSGSAGLFATARTIGLDGGLDSDLLVNAAGAQIIGQATSSVRVDSGSTSFAGNAAAAGLGRAASQAIGMTGGMGNDTLVNRGLIRQTATSTAEVTSGSFAIVGETASGGDLRSESLAVGMDGGTGDDILESTGSLDILAESVGRFTGGSFNLAGRTRAGGAIGATATAYGMMDLAGQSNRFVLGGTAANLVRAIATSTVSSSVSMGLGSAGSQSGVGSNASAIGIFGGGAADTILQAGRLDVIATARASLSSSQYVFAGAQQVRDAGEVLAFATGLDGGSGNNHLESIARLQVRSEVDISGSAGASTLAGKLNASGKLLGRSEARGMAGSTGVDSFVVSNVVQVNAVARASTSASVSGFSLFTDGRARSEARTFPVAVGIADLGGDTAVRIDSGAFLIVTAGNPESNLYYRALASASSNGIKVLGINADAHATTFARVQSSAVGVLLGFGTHEVLNAGTIRVVVDGFADATSTARGNSALSGDGTAKAEAMVSGSGARGISTSGYLRLENRGLISVDAFPTAAAYAFAGAAGIDIGRDPDADATATAWANGIQAIGVDMATGEVLNTGFIEAYARPRAVVSEVRAQRSSGTATIDAFATGTAQANSALAIGIRGSIGNNRIVNRGTIIARALPNADAVVVARGAGPFDGDGEGTINTQALGAPAYGIRTGAGDDYIENRGTITVEATPRALGSLDVSKSGTGERKRRNFCCQTSRTAAAISSTGGNNIIINSGSVEAPGGTAIELGDGADLVWLRGGSIEGDMLLGAGDDWLAIEGTPRIEGLVDAGAGRDLMTVDGAVRFADGTMGFHSLVKSGDGDADLGPLAWNPAGETRILGGRVVIAEGLQDPGHRLVTVIRPNGTGTSLHIAGEGPAAPRGTLLVLREAGGPMVDGLSWDVVTSAGPLSVEGLEVRLAAPTALVRINGVAEEARFRVAADVLPIASLAAPGLERSFAAALDGLTPVAEGQVAQLITGLQALSTPGEVTGVLQALSPRMPALSIGSAGAALDAALAALGGGFAGVPAAPGLRMVRAGSPSGSWAAGFAGVAGSGGGGGRGVVTGMASGMAFALGEGARLQLGMVRQFGSHQASGQGGAGQSRSMLVAAELRAAPAEGAELGVRVAAGRHSFAGGRAGIGVRAPGAPLRLDQGSRLFAAEVMAAAPLPVAAGVRLEAGLSHRSAAGEASREAGGANGLALIVDNASALRNEGRVALAAAPEWRLSTPGLLDRARLVARVSAGWVHQFSSAAGRVSARFADMPEHRFDLRTAGAPRDALAFDIGLALEPAHGPRLLLGAQQRPEAGGLERAAQISLDWRF